MANEIDHDRRRFLGMAVMTIAAAHFGTFGSAEAPPRESRELAALGRANEWLNSPRLTPAALNGKVVLVDFWTYTCINWLRTLPYIRAWASKYKDHGLVVIGVHTPEFEFEKNVDNVRRAVSQMRISYPIVIDNDYAIWRAFKQPVLAGPLLRRCARTCSPAPFRRRRVQTSEKTIQRLLKEAGASGVHAMVWFRLTAAASRRRPTGTT